MFAKINQNVERGYQRAIKYTEKTLYQNSMITRYETG